MLIFVVIASGTAVICERNEAIRVKVRTSIGIADRHASSQ
jgi:hypothetical protein